MMIDVAFDFRSDTPAGKDPDAVSPTLRRYHRYLWSKPLPGGGMFDLSVSRPGHYLYHQHPVFGDFSLSSDAVMQTFTGNTRPAYLEQCLESENEAFRTIAYTIGAMMVFPGNRIDRKMTINQARGCRPRIRDRFDLTVECIRLQYADAWNPLGDVLSRYANFFALFREFRGYVSFFLLEDLITSEGDVKFFTPFDNFKSPAIPQDVGTYLEYRRRSIEFIEARNHRVEQWTSRHECMTPSPATDDSSKS
jgi:hypothetical protein